MQDEKKARSIPTDAQSRTTLRLRERAFNYLYPAWNRIGPTRRLKLRRVEMMLAAADFSLEGPARILEVGCGNGQDFVHHLGSCKQVELFGMDIDDYGIEQENFTFVQGDASSIPFPDRHFDLVVSIGVLEHIEPISKLLTMIGEIRRVAKRFAIVVPSISTRLEPHTIEWRWQLKPHGTKRAVPALNYFSDEAWLQFDGFRNAEIKTFDYLPLLIRNVVIYSRIGSLPPEGTEKHLPNRQHES